MKKFVLLLFIAAITLFNAVSFAQDPWDDFTVPYLNFNDEDDGETEGGEGKTGSANQGDIIDRRSSERSH